MPVVAGSRYAFRNSRSAEQLLIWNKSGIDIGAAVMASCEVAKGQQRHKSSADDQPSSVLLAIMALRMAFKKCCGATSSVAIFASDGSLPTDIDGSVQTVVTVKNDPNRTYWTQIPWSGQMGPIQDNGGGEVILA